MTQPRIGIWIDDPPASLNKPVYWKELKSHGISTAAIMLESVTAGFDPRYKESNLRTIAALARPHDIELVLTVWPEPNQLYLKDLEARICPLLEWSGAAALEFDGESNWTPKKVKGFPNIDKAGDQLVRVYDHVRASSDVRIEFTTFTMHTENSSRADVAPHADRLLPQAYSVRNRTEGEVPWDHQHGPGQMQHLTLQRALAARGKGDVPKLSCGLAAYDQKWPGKTGEEAMREAYNTALIYKPEEIRYWSSKWVVGNKKNGYSSRFLKSLLVTA